MSAAWAHEVQRSIRGKWTIERVGEYRSRGTARLVALALRVLASDGSSYTVHSSRPTAHDESTAGVPVSRMPRPGEPELDLSEMGP